MIPRHFAYEEFLKMGPPKDAKRERERDIYIYRGIKNSNGGSYSELYRDHLERHPHTKF